MYSKITIAGVDITSFVKDYSITHKKGSDYSTGEILLGNEVSSYIDLGLAQEIIMTRGFSTSTDSTFFRGYLSSVETRSNLISVMVSDKIWILDRTLVSKSYEINTDASAGNGSEIAKDLIETYGGLSASVEDTGSTIIIKKFICRGDSVLERLKKLAKIYDYVVKYDPVLDKVLFRSKTYTTFGTELVVGTHIVNIPKWTVDYEKIVNKVDLTAGFQEVWTSELFSGDGSNTIFTTTFTPVSTKITIGGVLVTGGVVDSSEDYDYYVNKVLNTINFIEAPSAGSNNIQVDYSYEVPRKVVCKDDDSIAKYGLHQISVTYGDVQEVGDCVEKARKIIQRKKEPPISTDLRIIGVIGLLPGMSVKINDVANDFTRTVMINKIKINCPGSVDDYEVGDEILEESDYIYDINDRLRQVERELAGDQDILVQVFPFDNTITYENRYTELLHDYVDTANSFILGKAILGTTKLGLSYFQRNIPTALVQGNNTYKEYVYDTDFSDGTIGTATFNTSTNTISLYNRNSWTSKVISQGVTISSVALSIGSASSNITYQLSTTGTTNPSWESLTLNDVTTLSTSGTSVFLRLIENGGTNATVTVTKTVNNRFDKPAIKLILYEA